MGLCFQWNQIAGSRSRITDDGTTIRRSLVAASRRLRSPLSLARRTRSRYLELMHLHAFQNAVAFYHLCREIRLPAFLKSQLQRAASSIALNLSEGSGKNTPAERRRFSSIAMGSVRECQAIVALEPDTFPAEAKRLLDRIAAGVYRLVERS